MDALSPLDGRYAQTVDSLRPYFSEEALMKARLNVEVRYFIALSSERHVREFPKLKRSQEKALWKIVERFGDRQMREIKMLEKKTRHDVKALEYYLRSQLSKVKGLKSKQEFLHFGLTSEDVNNLAYGILIHEALRTVIVPELQGVVRTLGGMARRYGKNPMLSLTHGQPATPTLLGKELQVFVDRLDRQLTQLRAFRMQGKFGGAVGNYSAHRVAYPDVRWEKFGRSFVRSLGLTPLAHTTQINPHDDLAELSHIIIRISTILLDLSRDMWLYISRGIFRQRVIPGEIGSSTMPHKVNPIDFENAEGNLGLASALFSHFAEKLPVSRMQRDLSDSTVQRNIGVAFGYHLLALKSLAKGLSRVVPDRAVLQKELQDHPEVVAEAIQTVLRKHGITGAYEKLKALTRGESVSGEALRTYVISLEIPRSDKESLLGLLGS